ncbi:hypothetical protein pipiens_013434 [Culex pipiens pipiens]|uniref:C2 domain-containing protein n=1 Tax=Culex pipiens pipiens TaxID=38569 RepID=A0ABD1CYM6_CULPP
MVLGYSETTTISEDVCVLSAIGTAAVINLQQTDTIPSSSDGQDFDKEPLVNMMKCAICRNGNVPDVLLCTIEIPDGLQVNGRGILIQAHACRSKPCPPEGFDVKTTKFSCWLLEWLWV